jgi:C_GCAxxG_C_C family probable redox protein
MKNPDIARNHFNSGRNCSQSVLAAFEKETGMDPETALRIADGFGGGMARTQHVCGAVTGGIMVLGMLYSKGTNGTHAEKDNLYARVRRFMEAFKKRYGSATCSVLLDGCNLLTPEGQALFGKGGLKDRCAGFVVGACELLNDEIARRE